MIVVALSHNTKGYEKGKIRKVEKMRKHKISKVGIGIVAGVVASVVLTACSSPSKPVSSKTVSQPAPARYIVQTNTKGTTPAVASAIKVVAATSPAEILDDAITAFKNAGNCQVPPAPAPGTTVQEYVGDTKWGHGPQGITPSGATAVVVALVYQVNHLWYDVATPALVSNGKLSGVEATGASGNIATSPNYNNLASLPGTNCHWGTK